MKLDTDDNKYLKFVKSIKNPQDDENISVSKLAKGLEDDNKAERAIQGLKKDVYFFNIP